MGNFCSFLYYGLGLDCSIHHKTIRCFDLKNIIFSFKSRIIYELSRNIQNLTYLRYPTAIGLGDITSLPNLETLIIAEQYQEKEQ